MTLLQFLSPASITLDLKGTSKRDIIVNMLDLLMASGRVKDRELALQSLLAREEKMSTGMEHGVAIPHGKTEAVDELVACVGVARKPVDFEALDGKPSQIFIMTLSPNHRTGPHIQFLAEISQLLRSETMRQSLIAAKDVQTVLDLLK